MRRHLSSALKLAKVQIRGTASHLATPAEAERSFGSASARCFDMAIVSCKPMRSTHLFSIRASSARSSTREGAGALLRPVH